MDLSEAIRTRHAVRHYLNRPIEEDKLAVLREAAERYGAESGLRLCLFAEEPGAFAAEKPRYGMFSGCRNYFLLAGPKGMDEAVGYYGEHLVLLAAQLGLNTCWAALTFEKSRIPLTLADGEKLYDLIALGYGETQGVQHRSKDMKKVARITPDTPAWFISGVEAALLAPTAINQQQFYFSCEGNRVTVKALPGPCSKTDLGIVKYHFEIGAGTENFVWDT